MAITIEMNQKIQSLQIVDNIYIHTHVTTQQRNIRKKCVIIKRIIKMLKLLKGQKNVNES